MGFIYPPDGPKEWEWGNEGGEEGIFSKKCQDEIKGRKGEGCL